MWLIGNGLRLGIGLVHLRISWKKESESVKLINSGGAHTIVAIGLLGGVGGYCSDPFQKMR